MLDNIKALGKRDILYILGDFVFDSSHIEEYINEIKTYKCRIKLIMGNHDTKQLYKEFCTDSNIEIQLPLVSYKNFWLSHCPIHPQEMRNKKGNIHGHLHTSVLKDRKNMYFDVSPEKHNYGLVDFEVIKQTLERKTKWEEFLLWGTSTVTRILSVLVTGLKVRN